MKAPPPRFARPPQGGNPVRPGQAGSAGFLNKALRTGELA